jgi:pimeloyl-ACP methyl ester carboxylesterase/DNA-binding CsgD family transcriptional regulator
VTELGAAIRFVRFDGSRVAFAVSGEGPPLVATAWWVSHLELDWRAEAFRSFWGSTAAGRALVRYDHPGTGMSDREVDPTALTLDDEVALLGAVMDELGLGRVSLVGGSSGGCAAIAFAARFPERVDRLLLYGTYADGASIAPPDVREALVAAVRAHWGLGSRVLADVFVGAEDGEARRRFVRDQRASARAETAAALLELAYRMDVRPLLEQVRAPTVVVHRRADRAIPYACGHDLAGSIRGARLVSVDGDAHLPWVGDWMSVSRALGSFLTGTPAADPAAPAVLLSRREREVLTLIAGGLSDREIAERIAVSHHTVHRHVANIRHKLGSGSRAAAVAEAVRLGLL